MGLRIAVTVVALMCAVGSNAYATPTWDMEFGFNDQSFGEQPAVNQATLVQKELDAGASVHRFGLSWWAVQPGTSNGCQAGAIDWSPTVGNTTVDYDAEYARLTAENVGIRPVIVVMDAPLWAQGELSCGLLGNSCSSPTINCHTPPGDAYLSAWGNFVRQVALRYPEAAAIEVWNEPNAKTFWGASGPAVDPARYVRLFRRAADAVHQVNDERSGNDIKVLTAGLAYVKTESIGYMPISTYAQHMYANGLKSWMRPDDALAVHAGAWPLPGCLLPNPTPSV